MQPQAETALPRSTDQVGVLPVPRTVPSVKPEKFRNLLSDRPKNTGPVKFRCPASIEHRKNQPRSGHITTSIPVPMSVYSSTVLSCLAFQTAYCPVSGSNCSVGDMTEVQFQRIATFCFSKNFGQRRGLSSHQERLNV